MSNSGGKVISQTNPCLHQLANTWIISIPRWPTPEQPEVLLENAGRIDRASSFLNLACRRHLACYNMGRPKERFFLPNHLNNHGWEWRCYMPIPMAT